jgi:hypothetical protein
MMVAALLSRLHVALPPWRPVSLIALFAWVLTLTALLLGFDRLRTNATLEYQAALRPMQQAIPANASIMGSGFFWLDMRQHPYLIWQQLTYYRRYFPGSTLTDAMRAFHPDYLILDGNTDWHTSDHPEQYQPWAQLLYLPKTELNDFLKRQATLVAETPTYSLGDVRMYRINWDQDGGDK